MSLRPIEEIREALGELRRESYDEGYWGATYSSAYSENQAKQSADQAQSVVIAAISELAAAREEIERQRAQLQMQHEMELVNQKCMNDYDRELERLREEVRRKDEALQGILAQSYRASIYMNNTVGGCSFQTGPALDKAINNARAALSPKSTEGEG